ncbi:hypothetical protein D3C81_623010 [compost metagenome]
MLARLLLFSQCVELLLGDLQLLHAGLLPVLFLLEDLLALLLFGQLFLLLIELCQTLGDLAVELHEGRSWLDAQCLQRLGGQQAGECVEFVVQTRTVASEFALLIVQVPGRLLVRGFGVAQLLSQARRILLQGEQGGLSLLILADALVQLAVLLGEPGVTFGGVLIQQCGGQRVRFKAWRQGLLLGRQLLLLLQQLLLLGDQATDFRTQFSELFLEQVDGFLRVGLFAFIMAAKALQQRLGLMIRMLVAAADRARLIILQLRAQLLDTGTARQPLAFQQFAGDAEGLLGDAQFRLGFYPVLSQPLAFLLRVELTLLQLGAALVQFLLAGPQPRQVFDGAQLLAVVLQQAAENADLLGDGIRFGAGFLEQHFQLLFLRREFLCRARGVLFEAGQFDLAFIQSVADQHQLLQAIAVGVPGIAQRCQMDTLLQFGGDALQVPGDLGLLIEQVLNRALALGAGLLGTLLCLGAEGGVFGQTGEGALCFEGLTQQRRTVGLLLLRFIQGDARSADLLLQFGLTLAKFTLLPGLFGNQRRHR